MGRLYLAVGLLLALATAPAANAQTEQKADSIRAIMETHRGWRGAWAIGISAEPRSPATIPDSVIVTISNQSDTDLRGAGLILRLYYVDAWAIDEELQEKTLALAPGEVLSFRIEFSALTFKGLNGEPCDTTALFDRMRNEPWCIQCSLTDLWSPKPMTESCMSVSSKTLWFNQPERDTNKSDSTILIGR